MKKVVAFAFVALSLMTSCSSDDSSSVSEEKLVKKWYFKSTTYSGQTEVYEHLPCAKDYIQFAADGTYLEYYVNECSTPISVSFDNGNWILEGNTISLAVEGDSFSATITSLSDTKLQVTRVIDYDGDGDVETVKFNFTNN